MSKKIVNILGIESSCDDTGVAIINSNRSILANIVINQDSDHSEFLGVVPEIAARSHMENLETALMQCLQEVKMELSEIDAIAATCGPGLIGGVIVGAMFGKSLASVLGKPFIAVNHLEGHALTCRLTDGVAYPYLLLLVSGGHCQFVAVHELGKYTVLGRTLDDAVGEAFDKVAKMLGLEFPGGPKIEKIAADGNADRFDFPRPIYHKKSSDMSFSGLKTAVRSEIEQLGQMSEQDKCNVAASFQKTVAEILVKKSEYAMNQFSDLASGNNFVLSGGVAANEYIRGALRVVCDSNGYNFVAPPLKLCTDNAAMIAFAGLERLQSGIIGNISFKPRARWRLDDL